MKTQTKLLGISVVSLAVFSLYLAIANEIYLLGMGALPLEGRLSNDLVFPLLTFVILGVVLVINRRRIEEQPPVPRTG